MIDAKKNRLDYGAQLAPPEGYELDQAIGTTYSLDLEAILLVPVALFFSEDMDIDPKVIRDDTLEALVNASSKITIYHQRGKIKVPEQYSQLMAYWEKGICPIQLDAFNRSFHPKIWIIRYTEIIGKKVLYRIINTSRNLTFSRDWDLAITTDGIVDNAHNGLNPELIDFIQYLNNFKKVPKEFLKELSKVQFSPLDGFEKLCFHPIGIPDNKGNIYTNPLTSDLYKKDFRLIMSPFVDNETASFLADNCNESVLFSTEFELSKLNPEVLAKIDRVYMFSSFIEDAESLMELSESDVIPMNQNLHAKYFITQRGGQRNWYVGSANATTPANERNIEFIIEMRGGKYSYRPEAIEEELTNTQLGGISLFEKFHGNTIEEKEEEKKWQHELRKLIYNLSSIRFSADVIKNENETYDLEITAPFLDIIIPENVQVKLIPLPERSLASETIIFDQEIKITKYKGYDEIELSPFIIIEVWKENYLAKKFIVDMVIDLDQFSNRMNRIFSNIISNKSRFLTYLAFLLSDATPSVISDENDYNKKRGSQYSHNGIAFFDGSPIYEKLLIAASRNPEKLLKIGKLIDRIRDQKGVDDEPLISIDFEEMWEIFIHFSEKS